MIKRLPVVVPVLVLVGLIGACVSTPDLPPKAGPEEVELYDPNMGQYPDPGYESIGPVNAELPLGSPIPDLMTQLRAEAAELGADGVILQSVNQSTQGEMNSGASREEFIIARGLAIYYPAETEEASTTSQPSQS